jgi:hypothetical protein
MVKWNSAKNMTFGYWPATPVMGYVVSFGGLYGKFH